MEYQKFIPEGWTENKEEYTINNLEQIHNEGKIIQGYVERCDEKYNLHVNLGKNIEGIIPRNELDAINVDEYGFCKTQICKNKLNKFIQFKVKEIYNENNIILSRKSAQEDALNWIKTDLKPGMIIDGIIKNIRKFGAFVEIGAGIVGLIHIEDISVSRIKTPEERFYIGQKVKVVIKSIDKENNRIVLSYKELLGDWEENIQNFQEKMIVKGTVKETDKYKNGIFVELKPNLVGLAEYKEGFSYGQIVDVYIKKIIKDRKKIKLIIV